VRRCSEGGEDKAREQDRSLRDVINEALRHGLALSDTGQPPAYAFRLKTVAGRLLPGVDLTDRDKLFELMDRGSRVIALDRRGAGSGPPASRPPPEGVRVIRAERSRSPATLKVTHGLSL